MARKKRGKKKTLNEKNDAIYKTQCLESERFFYFYLTSASQLNLIF